MKIMIITILVSLFLFLNISGCIDENNSSGNHINENNPVAYMNTTMGSIKIELYQHLVPGTVENFIQYANNGFYDGLVIHRVIAGRMIQGGGYYPDGTYKAPIFDPIDLEIHQDARNIEGAIGIGPGVNDNNLTCQFYICVSTQENLDDKYPIFGVVTEGMDVVQSIANVQVDRKYELYNWPVTDIVINSVDIIG
jgi:cyclophilin family peptidyl-prolyl cis-trans isomerase